MFPRLWVGRENGVISVAEIAFSSDGRFLAISRPRGGVLLWDAENEVERQLPGLEYPNVMFLPNTHRILEWSLGRLTLRDGATGELKLTKTTSGERGLSFRSLSVDGRTLATATTDGAIKLWDTSSLEHVTTILGHSAGVNTVAWSPDGTVLASHSGGDGTVRLWDIATRRNLACLTTTCLMSPAH